MGITNDDLEMYLEKAEKEIKDLKKELNQRKTFISVPEEEESINLNACSSFWRAGKRFESIIFAPMDGDQDSQIWTFDDEDRARAVYHKICNYHSNIL